MIAPAVSIVLPVYNRLGYLRASMDSVFAQTFADFECIIADDGSDASTREYLRSLADPRIVVLWLEHSGNPGTARNAALAQARGKYIAFLDSDDYWPAHKLARHLDALRASPRHRWSFTCFECVDAANAPLPHDWAAHRRADFADILTMRTHVALPTVLAERSLLEEVGGFDEAQVQHGDYELWLRLVLRSEPLTLDESLAYVRNHREHYTRGGLWALQWKSRMYRKISGIVADGGQARALRAVRARNAGDLMRAHAKAGCGGELWNTFRSTLEFGWWRPRWWACGAVAVLRVITRIKVAS